MDFCQNKNLGRGRLVGGFTLIEAMVAVVVLVVGVLGPLVIAARGIADGFFARDQVIANYLAQEGMELVVNRRWTNRLQNAPWLEGLDFCDLSLGAVCRADAAAAGGVAFSVCSGGDCRLIYDEEAGLYRDPDLVINPRGTIFTRAIGLAAPEDIDGDAAPDQVKVLVEVSWRTGVLNRRFTLVDYLYRRP